MTVATSQVIQGPHLKLALLLGAASVFASLALLPYYHMLLPSKPTTTSLPSWAIDAVQVIQAGVVCWLMAWLGLRLGGRYGLDAPWLRAWVYRQPVMAPRPRWWLAILLGILAGAAVVGTNLMLHHTDGHPSAAQQIDLAWRGALGSFYGGVVEELVCRLLLVSLLVWLLALTTGRQARSWMFITAIVLAALVFGASHLTTAFATGMAHSVPEISRIVLLNAVIGVVCGCLFWKKGLEHAMLAHFGADLVLHVMSPLIDLLRV